MDFNIDNETFGNAYECLIDANEMLKNGIGSLSNLDSSGLKLIGKDTQLNNNRGDVRLQNIEDECTELYKKMRTTIICLSAMDIECNNYFENRFGDVDKSLDDFYEDVEESDDVGATSASDILTFADIWNATTGSGLDISDAILSLGIEKSGSDDPSILIPRSGVFYAATEAILNVGESLMDSSLKILTSADSFDLTQKSDTYDLLYDLTGNEEYSEMSDLLASRAVELDTSVEIAKKIAVDYSGDFMKPVHSGELNTGINTNGQTYKLIVDVGEYAPVLAAKVVGGSTAQASVAGILKYGEMLESGYAAAIAQAEREGRELLSSDVDLADVRATSQAVVDASIITLASNVKAAGKIDGFQSSYNFYSYATKATKPFINESLDTFVFEVDETDADGNKNPDGIVDSFDSDKATIDAIATVVSEYAAAKIPKIDTSNMGILNVNMTKLPSDSNDMSFNVLNNDLYKLVSKMPNEIINRYGKETAKNVTKKTLNVIAEG